MQVLRDLTGGSRGSYVECELCERRYLLPLGWWLLVLQTAELQLRVVEVSRFEG